MIRCATYDDIPRMTELLGELFAIEDDFTIDIQKQFTGLDLLLETPNVTVLVAESDQRVIAMATLQILISTAMGGYVGLIEDVIVNKSYRSRGIGKKLIQALIKEAEKKGLKRLALGADHRNESASEFYKKLGFSASHMGLMYITV